MLTILMPCAAVHTQGGCGSGERPAAASLACPACALCGARLWSQYGPAQDCMPGLIPSAASPCSQMLLPLPLLFAFAFAFTFTFALAFALMQKEAAFALELVLLLPHLCLLLPL